MSKVYRITVDATCINVKQKLPAMNQLEQWEREGKVRLLAAERLRQETATHVGASAKAATFEDVSEPWILGVSRLGCCYLSDGSGPQWHEVARVMFPDRWKALGENDTNDVALVLSHYHAGAEFLVTRNKKHFLAGGRKEELRARFGIDVEAPDQLVARLRDAHGW